MKCSASESKVFQSYSTVEIPSQARQEEWLSCMFQIEIGVPNPGVSNRWKSMIGKPINQSIKLVNWYWLVLVNRWPIDNHTKIVHRLASLRYLSNHPPFLGSPGDKIGKTIPTQTSQHKEYTLLHAYPNYPLALIAFPCHNVYARRPGRSFTEYKVHRQRLSSLPFWSERRWSVQPRRGENGETLLKLWTIVDNSAIYSPSSWILFGHYMQIFQC